MKIIQAEEEVGPHIAAVYRREMGVVSENDADPKRHMEAELVRELGEELSRPARKFNRRFHFTVIPDLVPKAFALPGGFIFISCGLLRLIETHRDETAFILAHEMGHVIQMHPVKRIVSDREHGGSMDRLRLPGKAEQWLEAAGMDVLQGAYSEERELLADKQAIRLTWAARFDPAAPIRMFRRLEDQVSIRDARALPPYFTSHPPFSKRIAQLREYIESHRSRPPR